MRFTPYMTPYMAFHYVWLCVKTSHNVYDKVLIKAHIYKAISRYRTKDASIACVGCGEMRHTVRDYSKNLKHS